MVVVKLTMPVQPGPPGKSTDGASPPNIPDFAVELSEWKELLQDVMDTVDDIEMLATLHILKTQDCRNRSKQWAVKPPM